MEPAPFPSDAPAPSGALPGDTDSLGADPLGMRWGALREAARAIGALAGGNSAQEVTALLAFPAGLRRADPRRARLIEQSIGDLVAIMEPGVAALLAVHERGGDVRPAARALWQEFTSARGGLLALVPPGDDQGL
ncbi:hypothetical protein FHW96_005216 [Novosphingobium sp. SG751A]|uniref:hypothetical protein n=1 Tax=Novosphingobium sp. SG751A TaxID=2587000 RepID=UPI0015573ED6|nr:hypothetical protein [Novosphingobium sp. SG751A]NOW49025.1 hypothetical protein [Novosphingobium sp. SG751A]